jgi:hypothetical protein
VRAVGFAPYWRPQLAEQQRKASIRRDIDTTLFTRNGMTRSFPSYVGLLARRCIVTGIVRTIALGFLAWVMHADIEVA